MLQDEFVDPNTNALPKRHNLRLRHGRVTLLSLHPIVGEIA